MTMLGGLALLPLTGREQPWVRILGGMGRAARRRTPAGPGRRFPAATDDDCTRVRLWIC